MGTAETCRFLAGLGSADDALDVLIDGDEDSSDAPDEAKTILFLWKSRDWNHAMAMGKE